MPVLGSYNQETPKISKFKSEYRLMVKDPRSSSESLCQKPEWWFLPSRTAQRAGTKMIDCLYKTAPDLTWEEKWADTEAALRERHPE